MESNELQQIYLSTHEKLVAAREECLRQILRQLLEREPLLADAVHLSFLRLNSAVIGFNTEYAVYFRDQYIGEMREGMTEVSFIPVTTSKVEAQGDY